MDIDFLDLLRDLPQRNVHTEISDIAIVKVINPKLSTLLV